MTNMGKLLKIFNNSNVYIEDISEKYEDVDKLFSITRLKAFFPFNVDFEALRKEGFEPVTFNSSTNMLEELIIKSVN